MRTQFSVNSYDRDGDINEECIFLHVSDEITLKFTKMKALEQFATDILTRTLPEIRENYPEAI